MSDEVDVKVDEVDVKETKGHRFPVNVRKKFLRDL